MGKTELVYFDYVAEIARGYAKDSKKTDIMSRRWRISEDDWMQHPINLQPLRERAGFHCIPDVYCYTGAPDGTMVVDFASTSVGGGYFRGFFGKEEQLVAQSTDFAMRLHKCRDTPGCSDAISYEGVHIDAWWSREHAGMQEQMDPNLAIQPCGPHPVTILAVDAPKMGHRSGYDKPSM